MRRALVMLLLAAACEGSTGSGADAGVAPEAGSQDPAPSPPVGPPPMDAPISGGGIDHDMLAVLLREGQLTGWVHGSVPGRGLYVFTYRKPGDFFTFADFPVAPATAAVGERLASLKRHDAIAIRGSFVENAAPIKHILLQDFTLQKEHRSDEVPPARTPVTRIPEDLAGKNPIVAKVHAVARDQRLLVVEIGDAVVPVFVPTAGFTDGLFRNDKIRIAYTVPAKPPRPTHLWIDTNHPKPLEVLERLVERHGQAIEAEGPLVRFPISPQITVDVYAVQVTDGDGIVREYTLLNTESPDVFTAIRDKLGRAWAARKGQGVDGRNKLVNPSLRVRARGTFNVVDRNQANAQILLASPDDVTVTMLP